MRRIPKEAKVIIALGVVAAVVLGGIFLSRYNAELAANTSQQKQEAEANPDDFDPKTDSRGAQREAAQDDATADNDGATSSGSGATTKPSQPKNGTSGAHPATPKKTVKPIITGIDVRPSYVEVGALTNGVTSGTCTATFSRAGSADVTKSTKVALVATSYGCTMQVDRTQLSNGEWTVKVAVDGPDAAGVSDSQKVTVK